MRLVAKWAERLPQTLVDAGWTPPDDSGQPPDPGAAWHK
jgi:hypothetical protein